MMNLPERYKKLKADDGSWEKLPAGAYICKIGGVKLQESKEKGLPMLVMSLDVCEGDYKGIFLRTHKQRKQKNPDAKFPCLFYQLLTEERIPRFHHILNVCAKMNPNLPFKDFEEWYDQGQNEELLRGCKVGVMFREEEFETKDKKIRTNVKPDRIDVWENLKDKEPPAIKKLAKSQPEPVSFGGYQSSDDDDDVPF